VRSPLATISAGSVRSIRPRTPALGGGASTAPTWRSERWRILVGTAGAGYRLARATDETSEIFDDVYLGLRAGGALRKRRRGEPLTTEEEEAIGRWERLSTARQIAAVGAFGVGLFGLGFTLGGLVFGRRRKR
jgi:hypothetical protein